MLSHYAREVVFGLISEGHAVEVTDLSEHFEAMATAVQEEWEAEQIEKAFEAAPLIHTFPWDAVGVW